MKRLGLLRRKIDKRPSNEEGLGGKEVSYERLEELSTCEMGMQVSYSYFSEVSQEGHLGRSSLFKKAQISCKYTLLQLDVV